MAKFCGQCGNAMDVDEKFCSQCGMEVGDTVNSKNLLSTNFDIENSIKKTSNIEGGSKKMIIKIMAVLVIIIGMAGFYFYQKAQKGDMSTQIAVPPATAEHSTDGKSGQEQKNDGVDNGNPLIKQTQKILADKKVIGNVVGTSLGHNDKGTLVLIKSENQFKFIIIDNVDKMVAEVPFSVEAYNLARSTEKKIIFDMTVYNDTRGEDHKNGVWKGDNHLISVYALYEVEENNVIPGMLTTGVGAKPSHYQEYFYEQKNVNLINLFLTEMKALNLNCVANNVIIPN